MTTEIISASQGALERGSQFIMAAHDSITSELNQMKSDVQSLGSHWSGDAAKEFTKLMEHYDRKTRKLNEQLIGLSESIKKTHKGHVQHEEKSRISTKVLLDMLNA